MTDYNDGKWHDWQDGSSPVHKESKVEVFGVQPSQGPFHESSPANHVVWPWVKIFRVIKPYREPREFWIDTDEMLAYSDDHGVGFMHVREVLPD